MSLDQISKFFIEFSLLIFHFSPALCLGLVVSGLTHAFFSKKSLQQHFGQSRFASLNTLALASIYPGCSCGVVAQAKTFLRKELPKEMVLIFCVVGPQIGPAAIVISLCFLGPQFTVMRILLALIMMLVVTKSLGLFSYQQHHQLSHEVDATHEEIISNNRLKSAFGYAFGENLQEIKWPFLIAMAFAALMLTFNISEYIQTLDDNMLTYLSTFTFCGFIDICATDSAPIAGSMLMSKVSVSIVLIFIVAGPSLNYMLLDFVYRAYGMTHAIAYVLAIACVTLTTAWGLRYLDPVLIPIMQLPQLTHDEPVWKLASCTVCTIILIVAAIRKK